MDFIGAVRLLIRRWYVVVPTMLVSAVLAGVTYLSIPTSYQSTGVMVLTSPAAGPSFSALVKPEDVPKVNPLLAFDSSLSTTAQIVIQVLRDPATAADLGITDDTDLKFDVNTGDLPGPFIFVEVTGNSAQQVRDTVGRILERAQSELASRQRALNAPEQTFITAQLLVQPTEPAPLTGGKVRFTAAALLVGGLLTLTAPFAFESITARRRGRPNPFTREPGHNPPPAPHPAQEVAIAGSPPFAVPAHHVTAMSGMPGSADPASGPPAEMWANGVGNRSVDPPLEPAPGAGAVPAGGTSIGSAAGGDAPERPRAGRRPAPRLRPQSGRNGDGAPPPSDTAPRPYPTD